MCGSCFPVSVVFLLESAVGKANVFEELAGPFFDCFEFFSGGPTAVFPELIARFHPFRCGEMLRVHWLFTEDVTDEFVYRVLFEPIYLFCHLYDTVKIILSVR